MSKAITLVNRQQVLKRAGEWLARLERGLSKAEADRISVWLSESPTHRKVLLELCRLWDDMAVLDELASLAEPSDATPEAPGTNEPREEAPAH